MIIWLNGYELNTSTNRTTLNEPIEGLDLPSIRTSRGINSGQAGGFVALQLWGVRSVAISGTIFSSDYIEALAKRRDMQSHLALDNQSVQVRILDDDGALYTFTAYLIDFKMDIQRSRRVSPFKIELEAPDPVIYDDTAGAALSSVVNQVVPGGFQFTTTSPQFGSSFYFSEGSAWTTVTNTSTVRSFPYITIIGKTTNPSFLNRATGEVFKLDGYGTDATAATVIDMAEHTVLQGLASDLDSEGRFLPGRGSSAFAYVPVDSTWWGLLPGDNQIEFVSTGGGDSTQADIRWRPGYMGI